MFKMFIAFTFVVLAAGARADMTVRQRPTATLEASPAMAHDHPTGIQLPLADVTAISDIMDDQDEVAIEETSTDALTVRQ